MLGGSIDVAQHNGCKQEDQMPMEMQVLDTGHVAAQQGNLFCVKHRILVLRAGAPGSTEQDPSGVEQVSSAPQQGIYPVKDMLLSDTQCIVLAEVICDTCEGQLESQGMKDR